MKNLCYMQLCQNPIPRLCFYQRVLTDPNRILLRLIPCFLSSNRISAIFNAKRWSQWDQRWTTSKGGLNLDPIGIKGYFCLLLYILQIQRPNYTFTEIIFCDTSFDSFAVVYCNIHFNTMSLPWKTRGPLNGCNGFAHGFAHGNSTVSS